MKTIKMIFKSVKNRYKTSFVSRDLSSLFFRPEVNVHIKPISQYN